MPRISSLAGHSLIIFYNDHEPPHIHIKGEYKAKMDLDGNVLYGHLSQAVQKEISAWVALYKTEILALWNNATQGIQISKII